jgi:type I restriction enzyme M protein
MINKDSFKKLLSRLGFSESKNVLTKMFQDFELKADFNKEELIYPPELTINEKQTCNFSSNENFVVFECVHRLLEKGYKPKHIELEPKWKLGHGASGGRADIWVKENDGHSLLIIECKTAGKEFENAWKDTLDNGGQLFSYFQQEKSTKFLALYTSDFIDSAIKYEYKLITVIDNEDYLKSLGKKEVSSFKTADTVKKIFVTWDETYQKDFSTKGIFENDIPAYHIGKKKYSVADLKEVDNESIQKKYHEFATILRRHNVSGHENAFDKLVNLFLAKIVDEIINKDELAFYWKGAAYDDIKSLIDRLQKHYKIGMEMFLKEDVTYIEKTQIDDAFKLFKNKPDATKAKILEYFDQLKYYTNNDFAFIDVHNEKLFYQNSKVLLEIVLMLQDIRLQTETQNQFLGDLFEGFLDKGVKQSEGQFFTPMPIVKFLISSLPLESLIIENSEIPKVIDYACGAGHFLNEYAHQISPIVKKFYGTDKVKEYNSKIVGIEKEYRLSKVAKVSAFMYDQDDIEIIYADALASNKSIKDGSFSILVANPPYSVKGFLETLDDESLEKFELFNYIDDKQKKTNNSIECFFVERAKQLLKPNGVAAIVLPSPILNNGNIYIKTREILLKYFDLVAIAEFGSGTFGKTGTSTATLFLRRKDNNPDLAEHYKNRVEDWFTNDFSADKVFKDNELIKNYCKKIEIEFSDFKSLLAGSPNEALLKTEIFKEYRKSFESSTDFKSIQKKKITEKYKHSDKEFEIENAFINFVVSIEKEKLYYFMLAESNPQPVCIIKSPNDNKAIKTFLGYEWSARKGSEGIKFLFNSSEEEDEEGFVLSKGINSIKTPLFNPLNLYDNEKINSIIRGNFLGQQSAGNEFVSFIKLSDMIDFSRVSFDKAIKTNVENKVELKSKYDLVKLGGSDGVCDILIGGTPSRSINRYFTGQNLWVSISEMNGNLITDTKEKITDEAINNSNVKLIPKGTTLLSFKLSIGKTAIAGANLYTNEAIAGLIPKNKKIITDSYLFHLFNGKMIDLENVGSKVFGKSLNSTYLKDEIKIPLPPVEIQKKIVIECEKVDELRRKYQDQIKVNENRINTLFQNAYNKANSILKLSNREVFRVNIGKRIVESELVDNGKYPVFSANVFEPFGKVNKELPIKDLDFASPSILWGIDGDWQVNCISENKPFYPTDHCGVLRVITNDVEPKYLAWALYEAGKAQRFSRTIRASIDRIEALSIKIPSITEQKRVVKEVTECEINIEEAKKVIESIDSKKREILNKYLN